MIWEKSARAGCNQGSVPSFDDAAQTRSGSALNVGFHFLG